MSEIIDPFVDVSYSIDQLFESFRTDSIPDEQQPIAAKFLEFYQWLKEELPSSPYTFSCLNALAQSQMFGIAAAQEKRG